MSDKIECIDDPVTLERALEKNRELTAELAELHAVKRRYEQLLSDYGDLELKYAELRDNSRRALIEELESL